MAEISFNNKFDQMNKLNQQFYDDYFEDNYDPTKPMNQQSNSLTMKSLNDGSTTPDFAAMQSAYNDAQKSKTKNSFFSMSADAAEMPQVPNFSLGTPQINFNTGITGASSAIPNINGVPMINTSAYNQKLQNTDLVSQIIAANQAANANKFGNTVAPFPGNQFSQVNNQVPSQNFEFLQSAYEDQDEDAAQVEYLPGQKKKLSDMGRNFGISSLIGMITGNPIIGLLSRGMKGLGALNDKMQNSDFGQSRTGAEYFMKRRERKQGERARAANADVYASADRQGFTNDRGGFSTNRADRAGTSVGSGQFNSKTSRGRTGY